MTLLNNNETLLLIICLDKLWHNKVLTTEQSEKSAAIKAKKLKENS
jgi:hypothetical protein